MDNIEVRMQEKLSDQWVILMPLVENHRAILKPLAEDQSIWTYMPTNSAGKHFDTWFDKALAAQAEGHQIVFVVVRREDQTVVGSTRLYQVDYEHKKLHIGYTWYTQGARGTHVNSEAKWLLLQYAFESLDFNRVEFNADARNLRSCAAIEKLGAIQEGVLRQHMIVQKGYVRDTVVFSIIKDQWPMVNDRLKQRLHRP